MAEFQDLQAAGINVFAFDAHSFGRSEPQEELLRSYVTSVDRYVDDVYTFLQVLTPF